MSAEYTGKQDADKTVPVLPRPLRRLSHRVRALNLTGDASGNSPTDGGLFWGGETRARKNAAETNVLRNMAIDAAIDAAWYD